ncbi:hypothetical protein RCH07_003189 [Arthrobacter sp. CG_A4]|nr:hypothetical protein [Arthrobacter sp. CG_A4]
MLLSLAVAASIFFRFTNTFFGSGYPSMGGRGI